MDQTAGMLDEDVQEKGYALLCVAQPQSDCTVQTIEEVRVQQQQFAMSCAAAVNAALHNWQQMSAPPTKVLGLHVIHGVTHGPGRHAFVPCICMACSQPACTL